MKLIPKYFYLIDALVSSTQRIRERHAVRSIANKLNYFVDTISFSRLSGFIILLSNI